jgi:hypothetical protein
MQLTENELDYFVRSLDAVTRDARNLKCRMAQENFRNGVYTHRLKSVLTKIIRRRSGASLGPWHERLDAAPQASVQLQAAIDRHRHVHVWTQIWAFQIEQQSNDGRRTSDVRRYARLHIRIQRCSTTELMHHALQHHNEKI